MSLRTVSILLLVLTASAQSPQSAYGQCGGSSYAGATACVNGYICSKLNDVYAQCVPGTATTAATTATITSADVTTTISNAVTPTLQSGWYWIRAVESPNFHSYLQTKPTGTPGIAYLDLNTDAGQFNIASGQVVYNTGDADSSLYMNVENPTNKTQRKLQTWFNTTENSYGTFAWSGDSLTWSVSDIQRPNNAAWYVCGAQELYINTGAYLYGTPSGCADETIHSYGGSTPNI